MGRKGWKAGGPFRPSSRNLSQLREAASQSDRAAVSWDQTPRDSFAAPQWSIPRRAQNSSGPRQQRVRSGVGVSPPPFRQPLPPLLRGKAPCILQPGVGTASSPADSAPTPSLLGGICPPASIINLGAVSLYLFQKQVLRSRELSPEKPIN